jgi:hypothetical protein
VIFIIKVKETSLPIEQTILQNTVESTAPTSASSLLGNINPTQLMGMVNKLGGIDGILNTITKVNKMIATVQQMSAMFRMFGGSMFNKRDEPEPIRPKAPLAKRRRSPTRRKPRKRRRR